jgi:transcriptional regulator GlxA family with amidase domain
MEPSCAGCPQPESGMIVLVRDNPAIGVPQGRVTASDPSLPTVAIVVYDGLTLFEFSVAHDIFGTDRSDVFGRPLYRLLVCGVSPGMVTTHGGLQLEVTHGLDHIAGADTVVVPPTEKLEQVPGEVIAALRAAHGRGQRIVSLCTGAFILARAGLLDGRRATTHWVDCDDLATRFPQVSVDRRVLYVDDGDILTSAGSAASIDLCLYLVRQDHGSDIATQLARQLVAPPQRDGGQAQYIDAPLPEPDSTHLFAATMTWLQEHLDEQVTVDDLAQRSAMSPRTFARRFLGATGTTPYQWLLRQRLQLAQRLLETTDLSIEVVADRSGFCTSGNLRKHFGRLFGTSPQAYRRTFRQPLPR